MSVFNQTRSDKINTFTKRAEKAVITLEETFQLSEANTHAFQIIDTGVVVEIIGVSGAYGAHLSRAGLRRIWDFNLNTVTQIIVDKNEVPVSGSPAVEFEPMATRPVDKMATKIRTALEANGLLNG